MGRQTVIVRDVGDRKKVGELWLYSGDLHAEWPTCLLNDSEPELAVILSREFLQKLDQIYFVNVRLIGKLHKVIPVFPEQREPWWLFFVRKRIIRRITKMFPVWDHFVIDYLNKRFEGQYVFR